MNPLTQRKASFCTPNAETCKKIAQVSVAALALATIITCLFLAVTNGGVQANMTGVIVTATLSAMSIASFIILSCINCKTKKPPTINFPKEYVTYPHKETEPQSASLLKSSAHIQPVPRFFSTYCTIESRNLDIDALSRDREIQLQDLNAIIESTFPNPITNPKDGAPDPVFRMTNFLLHGQTNHRGITKEKAQKALMRHYSNDQRNRFVNGFSHEFIQSLFPTTQQSTIQPNAPRMDPTDLKKLISQKTHSQEVIRQHFKLFLNFYGIEMDNNPANPTPTIIISDKMYTFIAGDFPARASRVLTCLKQFQLHEEYAIFKDCLKYIHDDICVHGNHPELKTSISNAKRHWDSN